MAFFGYVFGYFFLIWYFNYYFTLSVARQRCRCSKCLRRRVWGGLRRRFFSLFSGAGLACSGGFPFVTGLYSVGVLHLVWCFPVFGEDALSWARVWPVAVFATFDEPLGILRFVSLCKLVSPLVEVTHTPGHEKACTGRSL